MQIICKRTVSNTDVVDLSLKQIIMRQIYDALTIKYTIYDQRNA